MTDIDWTEPRRRGRQRRSAVLALAEAILRAVPRFFRAIERNAEHRRAIRDLQAMPDHMLKDMGVARAAIVRRVRGLPED